MLKNLIVTALRNFRKNWVSFFINVWGAATRLKEIKCPVLIIRGDKDIPFILQVTAWYQHELSAARLVNFPGVAHMLNMEKPALFNRIVYGWLKEH